MKRKNWPVGDYLDGDFMSASERLGALDGAGVHGTAADVAVAFKLRLALPLIADVVEAAEGEWAAWDACGYPEDLGPETRKLRDSLTALREHLEGGDVT